MLRDLGDPIPDRAMPPGIDIRPVVESDHGRIWDADVEAFRDHWDAAEPTESDFASWFAAPDRHRSHGCVRVQNALDFAFQLASEDGVADKFQEVLAIYE